MDVRFGSLTLWSLYRASSLKTAASEPVKYNSDLGAVQEVRWVGGGTQPADDCVFFCGNGNAIIT